MRPHPAPQSCTLNLVPRTSATGLKGEVPQLISYLQIDCQAHGSACQPQSAAYALGMDEPVDDYLGDGAYVTCPRSRARFSRQ